MKLSVCAVHIPQWFSVVSPSLEQRRFLCGNAVIKHVDLRVVCVDPRTLCLLGVTPRSAQLIALQL